MRSLDLFNLGITLLPVSVLANINKNGIDEIDKSIVAANHHLLAAGLLKNIPRFENIAKIIELQSKNYDGSGEPKNEIISGKEIPLGSRILKILNDLVKSSGSSSGVKDILLKMESQEYKYDVELIQSIRQNLTNKPLASGEEHLPVTKLKPGMIVLKDIYTINGHQRLLKAGSILTDTFINILRQWHKRDPIAEPIKISN